MAHLHMAPQFSVVGSSAHGMNGITPLKIIIRDTNYDVIAAALDAGLNAEEVSIVDMPADAVVSPANSFGFMDGGVDHVYTEYFGKTTEDRVQERISWLLHGELLVGQALAVETHSPTIPNLIVAPTMRVPKQIHDPADVMIATRAAVKIAVDRGFRTVAFPGMGTGCGKVPPRVAVAAMKAGIMAAMGMFRRPTTWLEAQRRHYGLAELVKTND